MKRKEILERLTRAMAVADTQEAKVNAVTAVMEEVRKAPDEDDDRGKPKAEFLTSKDVEKLLEERNAKMMERFEALMQGRSERQADRTLPFEVRDAEMAAHAYGIEDLPMERRMIMGKADLDEASIEGEERNLTLSAQRQAGRLYLAAIMCKTHPKALRRYKNYQKTFKALRETRAMDEFTPGEGLEWVPTRWTGVLLDRVEAALLVANLFPEIQMRTKSETFGIRGAKPVTYHLGNYPLSDTEAEIPASTPGTDDLTLTAKDLFSRVIVADNLVEDAAFQVMAIVEEDMIRSCREAIEDAYINGDTASALDPGYAYALSPRTAFDGIRKLTGAGYKYDVTATANFEPEDLDEVRLLMGANWGADMTRLVWITSFLGQMRISQFDDVQTLKDYGPNAVILRGELGNIKGVPIVVSPFVSQNLNAAGVYDGVTTTYTIAMCVHRDGFVRGNRRDVTLKSGELISRAQRQIVLVWRGAFERRYGTTEPAIVGQAYKIS